MFELGTELARRGMLGALMTGYPRFKLKAESHLVPYLKTFPQFHTLFRLVSRYTGVELNYQDRIIFDWFTSRNLPDCDVFLGVAASTLQTGFRARKRGAAYVVDRPCSHVAFQDRVVQEEAKRESIHVPPIDPRIVKREIEEYEQADLVTVPSLFSYNSFLNEGFPEKKLRVVPYGVDTETFKPFEPKREGAFDIMHAGLSSVRKGIPHVLRAYERLERPGKSLTLVGTVLHEVEPLLNSFRQKHEVKLTGHLSQDQVARHMSQSHVLVLASVEDGYGLVINQALACGTPVVASRSTGADMVITHGEEGFLFDAADDEALTGYLQQMADDPALTARMGEKALAKARSLGGWSQYGDGIVAMFRELRG